MRVSNAGRVPARVAGKTLLPGEAHDIPENHWHGWLARSEANQAFANKFLLVGASPTPAGPAEPTQPPARRPSPPEPPTPPRAPSTIDPGIVDAAAGSLDHKDDKVWTEAGFPTVDALQKATGYRELRATDRDASVERAGIKRQQ